MRVWTLAIAAVGVVTLTRAANGNDSWTMFIRHPSKTCQAALAGPLKECSGADCARVAVPDSELEALCHLIERGDSLAVELGMLCLRGLDGGDLEDAMRSLGIVVDKKPHMALRLAKRSGLSRSEFDGLIAMLPESVIDHPERYRKAIRRRIASLETVSDPELSGLRQDGISTLEEYLKEVDK